MIRMSDPGREPGQYERFAANVKKARGGGIAAGVVGAGAFIVKAGPNILKTAKAIAHSVKK